MTLGTPPARADNPVGDFEFTFADAAPAGLREIEVAGVAGSRCARRPCTLVIAMHGLKRNARSARNGWRKLAEQHDLVVVAPRFDSARFPTRIFQRGGVEGEPDRSKWLYASIERLYDKLISDKQVTADGYILFGHSAGAQFAHRMALFSRDARLRAVVVANAGYYTLPTDADGAGGHAYPFSLAGTPVNDAERRRAFGRAIHIMLGADDDDPDHPQLNNSAGARAQGPHRLARGRFFYSVAKMEAARRAAPFNWRLHVVPGVAHNGRAMTKAAGVLLFGTR